jgi:hypothetical protein
MAWMIGLTWTEEPGSCVMIGDISLGISFEKGNSRVPTPPAVITVFKVRMLKLSFHMQPETGIMHTIYGIHSSGPASTRKSKWKAVAGSRDPLLRLNDSIAVHSF